MKRILIIAALFLSIGAMACAQKSLVNRAKNRVLDEEAPNISGAKSDIDMALTDPTTMNLANTYYVAGLVYQKSAIAEYFSYSSGNQYAFETMGEDAQKSLTYYKKAYELDRLPDAKGKVKPKYDNKIREGIQTLYKNSFMINCGANFFDKKEWEKATRAFLEHADIINHPLFEGKYALEKDSNYYQALFYAGMSARNGEMYQQALDIYNQLRDVNYKESAIYQNLCEIYKEMNDTATYEALLYEGMDKFQDPDRQYFFGNLINLYAFSGQYDKAIFMLNKAIEENPTTADYYNVRGSVYEQLNDNDNALVDYNKATELDPNFAEAILNKARMMYNNASQKEAAANNLPWTMIDKEMEKVYPLFEEAIPYFEQALEIFTSKNNSEGKTETMKILKMLYYKFISRNPSVYKAKYDDINNRLLYGD